MKKITNLLKNAAFFSININPIPLYKNDASSLSATIPLEQRANMNLKKKSIARSRIIMSKEKDVYNLSRMRV